MAMQRLAEKAHAQRQGLRCRRTAVRLVGHIQQADAAIGEKPEDNGCQILLTDGEESDAADAALMVRGKEADVAMLGTGEGGVALPKAFTNPDLITVQAKTDPDCLRYMPLVNSPRAQWPFHLAGAPLHFLYVAAVLYLQVDDVVPPGICTGGRHSLSRYRPHGNNKPLPRGDPPARTSSEAPTTGRIALVASLLATLGGDGGQM